MIDFDPGPPTAFANHFAALPDLSAHQALFWFSWGPIFYRGRLDGTAKVICIASDPGPMERIGGRTLIGDAGQRVQGFLTKLGLTRSYVCVNAHPYALFPSRGDEGLALLAGNAPLLAWRNALFGQLMTANVQAIIAFGEQAQRAVALWPGKGSTRVFDLPHPSSRNAGALATAWRNAVPQLRLLITPDADGSNTGPNYGSGIREADYSPIPKRDLPWGLPDFVGDDRWGRKSTPRHNNGASRPSSDLRNTLVWISPKV